ncbi:MAG: hypothetical protein K2X93_21495 [Candidatus Obscuribacterales bacterium]|nr:hypothetical protein [Candidatus Obscuribacterales bacterium]
MYIRGNCSEEQLLARAKSTTSNTTCYFVRGVQNLILGKVETGLQHLRWIVDHGDCDMDEFVMGACELARRTKFPDEKRR